jgi:hypothetical protein
MATRRCRVSDTSLSRTNQQSYLTHNQIWSALHTVTSYATMAGTMRKTDGAGEVQSKRARTSCTSPSPKALNRDTDQRRSHQADQT